MKKALVAAVAVAAFPVLAQAQTPGFYVGAEGGGSYLFSTTIAGQYIQPAIGWAAGAKAGYDFVGPRVELEGIYHENQTAGGNFPGSALNGKIGQANAMVNALYDFNFGSPIVPYIGVGAGIAFVDSYSPINSTAFAYQGILGVGYNVTPNLKFSVEGRYMGASTPTYAGSNWSDNNVLALIGVTVKFAPAPVVEPPAPAPTSAPSFMVFFDWDRSNLSAQALNTIKQAADAYKAKGSARITATGHTDTSGPESYNMALSLRRANTVKDALVRAGVPATAIAVVGRGEAGLLVPTADGVREPQNRRVEIVIQ